MMGLRDMDGCMVGQDCVRRAYAGSQVDIDIVWRAVADYIDAHHTHQIIKITRDNDLRRREWPTPHLDECRRHADDIMRRWLDGDSDSYESLKKAVSAHARDIAEMARDIIEPPPNWSSNFVSGMGYFVPRSLHPAKKPPEYRLGEGHSRP